MTTVQSSAIPRAALLPLAMALVLSAPLPPLAGQDMGTPLVAGRNEPQNGANILLPWEARDKFDRVRFMNESSSHFILREKGNPRTALIFLPPVPPPLDSEIPVLAPIDSGPPAPEELSAFMGEVFYPILGERLASDDLPRALRARLVAYRDGKIGIQNEIRARIVELKDADQQTRDQKLAALAAQEEPQVAELEAEAENLRHDLRPTGILGLPPDGPAARGRLGGNIRSSRDTPSAPAELRSEAEALLGAAFLEDGLTLPQRRLLEEAAEDLESRADSRPMRNQAAPGTRLIGFSPERSRILIPEDLPPALKGKIEGYLSAKKALKDGIRDSLHDLEDAYGDDRRRALARLASAQAQGILGLDAASEDIRRGLADIPGLRGPPPPPTLPPELASRIATYRRHKVELLRTLRMMLVAPSPASGSGAEPAAEDVGSRVQAWLHDTRNSSEIPRTSLRVSVAEFDRLQGELIAGLKREESGIRESLAAYVRATNGPSDRKSINDLLSDFEEARQQQEIWDRYRDYRAAVVTPGLSAGQRRLLFDAGIGELGLPLPAGEKIR